LGGVPATVLYDNMKTVVLARDVYGAGAHRFQSGFLDYARHYGFVPKLCKPYRAKTKGKVERFNRYLRESFYVPLESRLRQAGLVVDAQTANHEVRRWLAEVANVRVHATLLERPRERWERERSALQPLPRPYQGVQLSRQALAAVHQLVPVESWQHPLSTYQALAWEVRA
jgi:hypothetical protein